MCELQEGKQQIHPLLTVVQRFETNYGDILTAQPNIIVISEHPMAIATGIYLYFTGTRRFFFRRTIEGG